MYGEAQDMLKTIIKDRLLTATGIVGFYRANSIGKYRIFADLIAL